MLLRCLALCSLLSTVAVALEDPPVIRAMSPDLKTFVVSDGTKVELFDGATQKIIWRYQGIKSKVTALAFSPDGKRLAVGSEDKAVRLLDAPTGKELLRVIGEAPIEKVSFSQDGRVMIAKQSNQQLKKWDIATGKVIE